MNGTGLKANGVNGTHHGDGTNGVKADTHARATETAGEEATTRSAPHNTTHSRKESNPLAPPFIVSAPGKTIVYGEHAVVHGRAAIAAAISLRSYLLVTTLSKSKRTVSLLFPDIGLEHTWHIPDLPWTAFRREGKRRKYYDMVTTLDPELVEAMQPHVHSVSPDEKKTERRKQHQSAASAFLYLFLSLGSEQSSACVYTLRSTVPVGVGLGSSASICVCISTALLLQCRALSGPHPDQQSREAEEQLDRINRWAFVGELCIHGNPSGVDNTVATNGHAVLFQRTDYSRPPKVEILRTFPELGLLLIDTCQPKSTAAEVAKVGVLKKTHPGVVEHVFDAIDAITRSAHDAVATRAAAPEDSDEGEADELMVSQLGSLMTLNHGLLTSLGVSHPRLERLRYLVDQAGVGWTKLTGAGGGGCAITLLRPGTLKRAHTSTRQQNDGSDLNGSALTDVPPLQALESQLLEEGFAKYETTLGGDGVGVLYPAVLGGVEINQATFLEVEGREGIELLVGGRREEGEGWKYWRP